MPIQPFYASALALDWLFKGLLTNALFYFFIVAGGTVLTLLKLRASRWATALLWGFAGAALIAVSVAAVRIALSASQTPSINAENIERTVRQWATSFGYGVTPKSDADMHFCFLVALPTGRQVLVGRPKELDRYITMRAMVTISPQHQALLAKMRSADQARFFHGLAIEMARFKIGFAQSAPLQNVMLIRRLPIADTLTESVFMEAIEEVDMAELLVIESVRRELAQ